MGEWKKYRLADVVSLVIDHRGKTPKKLGGDWAETGYRALSAKSVKTRQIVNEDAIRCVDEEMYRRWMKDEIQRGDILVTSEAPYGEVYYWNSDEKIVLSQRLFGLRVKPEFDSAFIAHYMTSQAFKSEMDGRATGTTVFGLRQPELLDCKLWLPDLSTQRRIAAVLGALDDKIEVNRKICENLEAQAQALFKAWFVDFEPFGGKRPEGWKMGRLGEVAEYYDGKIEAAKLTPASYFSTENMLANREGAVDAETVPQSGVVPLCDEGCVLVSNIRPYFKKIIRVNCVGGHSPDVLCFKAKALERQWYLYRMLWDDAFFAYVMSSTKGTKMPRGDKGHIMDYPCVLPFANDIRKFNDTLASLSGRIEVANRESRALAAMRDALLPKLMSGELAVEKVEVGDACASLTGQGT